jgi:hypothetical protein
MTQKFKGVTVTQLVERLSVEGSELTKFAVAAVDARTRTQQNPDVSAYAVLRVLVR